MLFHPANTIMFFVLLSLVLYNYNKSFLKLIAVLAPAMAGLSLFLGKGKHYFRIYSLSLIWDFNNLNKLIGSAFLLVLLSTNIYALSQKKYKELIIGLVCCASVFIGLLGEDFFSMFFSLEIMMIMSSIIIFISNFSEKKSIYIDNCAKKYFLIHFLASNMILIGISYIISKTNSSEIVSINKLMENPQYSYIILFIMLTGMLINVAAFPFCGWMINYYKEVSSCGFLYLISFSTKLSMIILIKSFYGFSLLKYVGVATILYSGKKAISENNIFALLSQLSLIATSGVMLIGTSYVNELTLLTGIMCYLFMHIICKLLLAIVFVTFKDIKRITFCSELGVFKNHTVLICMIVGLLLIIGIPFSFTSYSKMGLSKLVSDQFFRFIIFFASVLPIISFPWKEFANSRKRIALKVNVYSKFSMIFTAIVCFVTGFLWPLTPIKRINFLYEEYSSYDELLKQLIIYGISVFIIKVFKVERKVNNSINIFEKGIDLLLFLYKKWKRLTLINFQHRDQNYFALGRQLTKKISILYNQQGSVFFTISLLIFILTYLLATSDNNKTLVLIY